jgi:hypothetical protein
VGIVENDGVVVLEETTSRSVRGRERVELGIPDHRVVSLSEKATRKKTISNLLSGNEHEVEHSMLTGEADRPITRPVVRVDESKILEAEASLQKQAEGLRNNQHVEAPKRVQIGLKDRHAPERSHVASQPIDPPHDGRRVEPDKR